MSLDSFENKFGRRYFPMSIEQYRSRTLKASIAVSSATEWFLTHSDTSDTDRGGRFFFGSAARLNYVDIVTTVTVRAV